MLESESEGEASKREHMRDETCRGARYQARQEGGFTIWMFAPLWATGALGIAGIAEPAVVNESVATKVSSRAWRQLVPVAG